MPGVMLDSLVQTVQRRVEAPQVQFLAGFGCACRCVVQRQVRGLMVQKLWLSRSCRSSLVVDIPFVAQRPIPMVFPFRKTTQRLPCAVLLLVVDAPVVLR